MHWGMRRRTLLHRGQVVRRPVRWRVVGCLRGMVVLICPSLIIHTSLLIEVSLLLSTANLGRAASVGVAQRARGSAVMPVIHLRASLL